MSDDSFRYLWKRGQVLSLRKSEHYALQCTLGVFCARDADVCVLFEERIEAVVQFHLFNIPQHDGDRRRFFGGAGVLG